jgi:membrane protein YqaA with SNARE-associated domain
MIAEPGLVGLFFGCFLAATIIPFFSESLILACLVAGYDPYEVLFMATAGNWVGGLTNYALGYLGDEALISRVFRMDPQKIHRFGDKVRRNGHWMALVTWVPVIGDPLAIALGLFRASFWKVALISLIARGTRYYILIFFLEYLL